RHAGVPAEGLTLPRAVVPAPRTPPHIGEGFSFSGRAQRLCNNRVIVLPPGPSQGKIGVTRTRPYLSEESMPHVMVRWSLAGAIGLGLVSCLLAAQQPPQNSRQAAQAAIIDLSNNLDAKDVSARAKKIVDEQDSCDISSVFRMKRSGGVGIGKAA